MVQSAFRTQKGQLGLLPTAVLYCAAYKRHLLAETKVTLRALRGPFPLVAMHPPSGLVAEPISARQRTIPACQTQQPCRRGPQSVPCVSRKPHPFPHGSGALLETATPPGDVWRYISRGRLNHAGSWLRLLSRCIRHLVYA